MRKARFRDLLLGLGIKPAQVKAEPLRVQPYDLEFLKNNQDLDAATFAACLRWIAKVNNLSCKNIANAIQKSTVAVNSWMNGKYKCSDENLRLFVLETALNLKGDRYVRKHKSL